MITSVHTLVYADDAAAARQFFRDVLGWDHVDTGGGWLIFKTGPSELDVHPTSGAQGAEVGSTGRQHEVTFMCDDIEQTMAEIEAKGGEFTSPVTDSGFGLTTMLRVPGAGDMMVYEPKHPQAHSM